MDPTESDGLTESVTEESAEESPVVQDQPVRRIMKGLKKYNSMVRKLKSRVNDKRVNPKVVKSKATAVVMSLAKVSRPNEDGQGVFFSCVISTAAAFDFTTFGLIVLSFTMLMSFLAIDLYFFSSFAVLSCHARQRGEGESGATDVVSRTDIYSL